MQNGKNESVSKKQKQGWKQFSGSVLVAEDNPSNSALIKALLQKHGIQPVITDNGQKAVEAALTQPFDLILMDMQMPVLNGFEATRALREKGITVPIVALTASVMKDDREQCVEVGCDDFLAKPVNRSQLQSVLESALEPEEPLAEHLEQINRETNQLNKLVDDVIPPLPPSIRKEDKQDD